MDGGVTWVVHPPVNGFGSQNWVYFLNSSKNWIITTTGTYYRTTNSGAKWQTVLTNTGYTDITGPMYRAKNGVFYLGGRNALYRSSNNGRTWKQVLSQMVATVI